jgi:hypothetical protein
VIAGPSGQFVLAQAAAANDDADQALADLRNWEAGGGIRSWARIDHEPVWDAMRDDPRFQALVGS